MAMTRQWGNEDRDVTDLCSFFFFLPPTPFNFLSRAWVVVFYQISDLQKNFIIFKESFFQPVLLLFGVFFGNHLNGWLSGDHVWKDLIMSYKAEIMLMRKIQVFRLRILSAKESGSGNSAQHRVACRVESLKPPSLLLFTLWTFVQWL